MDEKTKKAIYDRARRLRIKAEKTLNKSKDILYSLSEIDKAYISGLIDGEGSIHMTRKIKTGTFHAFVTVAMSDKNVIGWLAKKFGNKTVESSYPVRGSFKKIPKPIYRITLQGRRACLLCELIHPYLIVKRQQAEVLMEYPCDARISPGKKVNGSPINDIRIKLKDRLTELNGYFYQRHHPIK